MNNLDIDKLSDTTVALRNTVTSLLNKLRMIDDPASVLLVKKLAKVDSALTAVFIQIMQIKFYPKEFDNNRADTHPEDD